MVNKLFVATADWHLQKHAWAKYPTLRADSYYSLNQIVRYACDHHLDIFAAGDLIDKPYPDSYTVWQLMNYLTILSGHNLRVYFIQGQHEKVRDVPWLNLSNTSRHVDKCLMSYKRGLLIYGLDYRRPDELAQEIKNIPKTADFLMMHQVWQDFMGDLCESDGHFGMLPEIELLLTGDYHKTTIRPQLKDRHKWTALSPGSTCMQSIDEPSDKSFFVVYDDFSVETIPLITRQVFRYIIETGDDLVKFLDLQLPEAITQSYADTAVWDCMHKNIIDIKYNAQLDDAYTRITKAVGDDAHLFIRKLKKQSSKDKLVDQLTSNLTSNMASVGIITCLKNYCSQGEVHDYLLQLLQSNDPIATTNQIIIALLNKVALAGSVHANKKT